MLWRSIICFLIITSLSFLGIRRNKLENIDLRSHRKEMLVHFCLKFEMEVSSASGNIYHLANCNDGVCTHSVSETSKLQLY